MTLYCTTRMELHPFDPITPNEITRSVNILRAAFPSVNLRFKLIDVREPTKGTLIPFLEAERLGQKLPPTPSRVIQALFHRLDNGDFLKALLDIKNGQIAMLKTLPKEVQGPVDIDEMLEVEQLCLRHPAVQAEIAKMKLPEGYTVCNDPWIYGTDDPNESRRLFQCYMYIMECGHAETNHYSLPCSFSPVFDALTGELVRMDYLPTGSGHEFFPTTPWKRVKAVEYAADLHKMPMRTDLKPYTVQQLEGPSYQVTGNLVTWQKWRFRVGFNSREGMILYNVTYDSRNIFYRLALSEMTVPYGDPRRPYHRKQAFDVGDVGLGVTANQLSLGCDCLGYIKYFDGYRSDSKGNPVLLKNVICLHEQDAGLLFKHTNYRTSAATVVRNRQLVVQMICTVSNYEYIFAWTFDQAAGLEFEVRATGILSTMPIAEGVTVPWGTNVGPGVMAGYHQHMFSLRIDPAIDGYKNTVIYEESLPLPTDPVLNPFGVGYVAQRTAIERAGTATTNVATHRVFKIQNDNIMNPTSQRPVAYKINTIPSQMLLMSPDSFNSKRASFASEPVWVTKYRDDELYAAGEFTNQSVEDTGLSSWAKRDDSVVNEDVVFWHTFGLTHNPRPEDFPVMPVEMLKVGFKPDGFFEKNCALDVPGSTQSFNKSVLVEVRESDPEDSCCARPLAKDGTSWWLAGDQGTSSIVGATIDSLSKALQSRIITSVELVVLYLNRIAYFDRRGPRLNSTPVLNPNALKEAAESDRRRALGLEKGALDGIPFTVKDSYKVKGMTMAAGSPAFANLIAQEDSFAVAALRNAGALVLGKTNMPPMAIGGVQRGLYGRAESPYNPDYLPAAWHSGSSSGSGVAVASNLCAFGLGEETVSSGRSPASNNGLVAYTPSRGIISIRGNWPLFPLRDTVVPHTRTVRDMLHVLDALTVEDPDTSGDLWRTQTVVKLPKLAAIEPGDFMDLAKPGLLAGKRIGVPKMYVGTDLGGYEKIEIRPSILDLWRDAEKTLTKLGVTCVEVDFPAVSEYEQDRRGSRDLYERNMLPPGWNDLEINDMVSAAWEEFLQLNGDPELSTLANVNPWIIHADPPEAVDTQRSSKAHEGCDSIEYQRIVDRAKKGYGGPQTFPQLPEVLRGLERARTELFEDWMNERGLDAVVFPANADIAPSDADVDPISSAAAWRNGTVFSNMNHVMRHLGIPSVTVTMGIMEDTGMPVGLTFIGPAYSDKTLLSYAFDYELASRKREEPPLAPALAMESSILSNTISLSDTQNEDNGLTSSTLPQIEIQAEGRLKRSGAAEVKVRATMSYEGIQDKGFTVQVFVDGLERKQVDGEVTVEIAAEDRRSARLAASLVVILARHTITGYTIAKQIEISNLRKRHVVDYTITISYAIYGLIVHQDELAISRQDKVCLQSTPPAASFSADSFFAQPGLNKA
ncbi:hypothetical protein B7463_g2143, partial [Scytalidium lignicola]